jgi:hypothetical protein
MGRMMVWSPEGIERLAWFIREVDKLFKPHRSEDYDILLSKYLFIPTSPDIA